MQSKPNAFGDVRAENDHTALDEVFFEWQDYKTLLESSDRFIVVGRRGTGKSALAYRLAKIWSTRKSPVITVAPVEEQMIGLRPLAEKFGSTVSRIRAGIKIAWRYAVLLELALDLQQDYKTKRSIEADVFLSGHLSAWRSAGPNCVLRLRSKLKEYVVCHNTEEERIAELSAFLDVERVTEVVSRLMTGGNDKTFVLVVDRLDEGYEPDALGTGIVDGILYGTDDLRVSLGSRLRPIVFIRDNMLRAIESEDKDFTRNLESQVLRLHWDPQELFYMVAQRIRFALGVMKESDVKVWNAITANELHGREGFKRCLRLTLYRPRDVIALLNAAFYQAQRQGRTTLVDADFEISAKQISSTRYSDLGKEYDSVLPGVKALTSAFSGAEAKMTWGKAGQIVVTAMNGEQLTAQEKQHFEILQSPDEVLRALYGVGFLGVYDKRLSSFVFSHDGKSPSKSFSSQEIVMVHPCYWLALNIEGPEIGAQDAEEIYDEYEITIDSDSGEQRKKLLGQLMSELNGIPEGNAGAVQFEVWTKRCIEIVFAKSLSNVELRPNRNAVQRRDIVATNQATSGVWKRILEDYKTRQVIFEVKNFEKIGVEEFRQVSGYLGREYGGLAFIICRDSETGLRRGSELDAFREFYGKSQVIVKFPASQLVTILSKLRSPEKYDASDVALERILDTCIRMYAAGQSSVPERNTKKRRRNRHH